MHPPTEDAKLIEYSFEVEKLAAHRKRLVIETLASMSIEGIRQLVTEIEKELGDEADPVREAPLLPAFPPVRPI